MDGRYLANENIPAAIVRYLRERGEDVLLGNIYLGEGQKSEALGEFEEFLRLDPRDHVAPPARAMVRKLRDARFKPPRRAASS